MKFDRLYFQKENARLSTSNGLIARNIVNG